MIQLDIHSRQASQHITDTR